MNELLAAEPTYTWVRIGRKALDLTQEALAELVECSVEMISKIEQGRKTPSFDLEQRLRQHLGTVSATPTTPDQPFSKWISVRRRALDLSQATLADIVGCAPDTLKKIERGVLQPSVSLLESLAEPLLVPEVNKLAFVRWARGVQSGAAGPPPPLLVQPVQVQSNLPTLATTFVGRATERTAVFDLLRRSDVRLVTLTGPGGVGKTRLAQEIGADLQPEFADNVWFVDLAPVRTTDQLVQMLAQTLQIKEISGESLLTTIKRAIRQRHLLLLLDNFEQLVGSAPIVADLLTAAARLKLLITSRAPLHIRAEHEFPLAPLSLDGIYPDGVWFVRMPQPMDVPSVLTHIHRTLAVPEAIGQDSTANLLQYLQARHLLLVFEQPTVNGLATPVPAVQALIQRLQQAAPGLHILVTDHRSLWSSRADTLLTADEVAIQAVADSPAVALFLQRAQAIRSTLTPTHRHTILAAAAICSRLEGLPLAIELAASRSKHFSPAVLLGRLEQRLNVLTDGARDLPARHRTLRALLDWSYDLLDAPLQRLFVHCAVFDGGWTLPAAEAICAKTRTEQREVFDGLLQLANQSLITMNTSDGEDPRFTMLETIRGYAQERLAVRGSADLLQQQHTRYFCEMAERLAPQVYGAAQLTTFHVLAQEYNNLQKALQSTDAMGAWEIVSRLAVALLEFWDVRGYWTEGRYWLKRLQPHIHTLPIRLQATVLEASGILTFNQGDLPGAQLLFEGSLQGYRALADDTHIAAISNRLSVIARRGGHSAEARTLLSESMILYRRMDDQQGQAETLYLLGTVARTEEQLQQARSLYEQSLQLFRSLNHAEGVARLLFSAGTIARQVDGPTQALALLEESLTLYREIEHKDGIAKTLTELGDAYRSLEQYDQAQALYVESAAIREKLGDRWGQAIYLANRGILAADQEHFATAIAFYEESLILFREGGHEHFALYILLSLGDVALRQGDRDAARTFYLDSQALAKPASSEMAWSEWGLGYIAYQEGDLQEAKRLYRQSLYAYHNLGVESGVARVLVAWLEMLVAEREWGKAAQLYGPLQQFVERLGYRYDPVERRQWKQVAALWEVAHIEVRARPLDWEHIIAEVLA